MIYFPKTNKLRNSLYLPLFVISNLTQIFHSMCYKIKTLATPTNAQFHSPCIIQLLRSYMFQHCHHLQGVYTKISLKQHHHHHHKHQGLDPLICSVSRVTAARANTSLVFQLFSFLVVCIGMISKGFSFVAFFASVKASSICIHLSRLVCL